MGAAYGDRASRAPGDGAMTTGATGRPLRLHSPDHIRLGNRMKRRMTALSAGLLCAGLLSGVASQAQTPAPSPQGGAQSAIVLRAAHLFDGSTGRLTEPGVVVVQ